MRFPSKNSKKALVHGSFWYYHHGVHSPPPLALHPSDSVEKGSLLPARLDRHQIQGGGPRHGTRAVPAPLPRAVPYLRVSTAEQGASGLGLEAQQAAIAATAARLGVPLAAACVDAGVSGGLPLEQRPALIAALDQLQPGDVLVVAKRDRLGRSVLNVALIERLVSRKGARVVSCAGEGSDDDGPTSLLMRQIIDAFSQYERELIRHRTRAAMAAKRRRGEWLGHCPCTAPRAVPMAARSCRTRPSAPPCGGSGTCGATG